MYSCSCGMIQHCEKVFSLCVYKLHTPWKHSKNDTTFLGLLQQEASNSFQLAVSVLVRVGEVLMLLKSLKVFQTIFICRRKVNQRSVWRGADHTCLCSPSSDGRQETWDTSSIPYLQQPTQNPNNLLTRICWSMAQVLSPTELFFTSGLSKLVPHLSPKHRDLQFQCVLMGTKRGHFSPGFCSLGRAFAAWAGLSR